MQRSRSSAILPSFTLFGVLKGVTRFLYRSSEDVRWNGDRALPRERGIYLGKAVAVEARREQFIAWAMRRLPAAD